MRGEDMAAYLIVDIKITDRERYARYVEAVPATIAKYGGKFLVRAGRSETLEGSWNPARVVVVEFESFERAKQWWGSQDYSGPKALRQSASITNMILVEGVRSEP
jgi:uncharacterized protein (DUF1330 family)